MSEPIFSVLTGKDPCSQFTEDPNLDANGNCPNDRYYERYYATYQDCVNGELPYSIDEEDARKNCCTCQ